MKTLVEMKKGGTFDSALEAMAPQFGEWERIETLPDSQ